MEINKENYLTKLFVNEAKPAMKRHSGGGGAVLSGLIDGTVTSITVSNSCTKVRKYAFYELGALLDVTLPGKIAVVEDHAFENCSSLAEVTFDGAVAEIGPQAFSGCTNLLTINVPWSEGEVANAPWGATNATINYDVDKFTSELGKAILGQLKLA